MNLGEVLFYGFLRLYYSAWYLNSLQKLSDTTQLFQLTLKYSHADCFFNYFSNCLVLLIIKSHCVQLYCFLSISMLNYLQLQKERIRKMCRKQKFPSKEITELYGHLIFDDEKKVIFCFVPKVSEYLQLAQVFKSMYSVHGTPYSYPLFTFSTY